MSGYGDPYLQQLLALQAQRAAFEPKSKYGGETDKFLSEQDQFFQSIGYDPLDYAMPPQMNVEQFVNESGLPTVTVNGEQAWVGESPARSYYEGSSEDDEYAYVALKAMEHIDGGMSPLEARKWAAEQILAAQEEDPEAFADMDMSDKVLGDVDKYGADLNTRQSTVDRAIATKGQSADDFGMFKGGGMYSSGLGEDPMGYEQSEPQGSLADYQGIDPAQIHRLLTEQLKQKAAAPDVQQAALSSFQGSGGNAQPLGSGIVAGLTGKSTEPSYTNINNYEDLADSMKGGESGGNVADFVLRAMNAKKPGPLSAVAEYTQGPSEQDVRVGAAAQAGRNLYSKDAGVQQSARQAYADRQSDRAVRPNQGHQELLRRVMAVRASMGQEPLPSRPGPVRHNVNAGVQRAREKYAKKKAD